MRFQWIHNREKGREEGKSLGRYTSVSLWFDAYMACIEWTLKTTIFSELFSAFGQLSIKIIY